MSDRSWMLNVRAIAAAKTCVQLVESELSIRLRLSNPDFLELLVGYVELTGSESLRAAVLGLYQYAPGGQRGLPACLHAVDGGGRDNETAADLGGNVLLVDDQQAAEETVEYKGRTYARFNEGREFQGLYRGQPRYV